MLHEFREFNVDRLDIDELIALSAYGEMLRAEYARRNVDEPDFVDSQLKALRREIISRTEDKRVQRARQIKLSLEKLKSPAEKREALERELAALESQSA